MKTKPPPERGAAFFVLIDNRKKENFPGKFKLSKICVLFNWNLTRRNEFKTNRRNIEEVYGIFEKSIAKHIQMV